MANRRHILRGIDMAAEYARLQVLVPYLPDAVVETFRREYPTGETLGYFVPRPCHARHLRAIRVSRKNRTRVSVLATLVHEAAHAITDCRAAPRPLRRSYAKGVSAHGDAWRRAFLLLAHRGYGYTVLDGTYGVDLDHEFEKYLRKYLRRRHDVAIGRERCRRFEPSREGR